MIEYVEPYYFSYEFFQRYGEFPFGERGHDWEGIIQTYSDYFNEPDVVKTIKLMAFISGQKYAAMYCVHVDQAKSFGFVMVRSL